MMRMHYILHNEPFDSNATNSLFYFKIYKQFLYSVKKKKYSQENYLKPANLFDLKYCLKEHF